MESKRHNQFFDTFYRAESIKNHTPVTGLHPPPPPPPRPTRKKKDAKKSSRLFVVIVIIYSTQDSKDSKLLV